MPVFTVKGEKNPFLRAIFVQILIFLGLIGLSAAALQPVQQALQRGMLHIRDDLIARVETFIGREIRYSSIRPTIFGSFDIRNLNIMGSRFAERGTDGDADDVLLSVSRLRFSFSLLELIRGNKISVQRIQIDHPVIRMNLDQDRDILEVFSSLSKKGDDTEFLKKIAELLPGLPDLIIRNCFFSLKDGGRAYHIQDLNMDIRGDDREISIDGKLNAEFSHAGFFNRSFSIRTALGINGIYSAGVEEGRAEIALVSLSVTEQEATADQGTGTLFYLPSGAVKVLFDVRPVRVGFVLKDRAISLITLEEKTPYNGRFDYNTVTGAMAAAISCLDLPLMDVVSFSGAWKSGNQLLAQTVTGNASCVYESGGALNYSVNFSGGNIDEYGDSFSIRVKGSEKAVVVEEFIIDVSPPAGAGPFQGKFAFFGNTELAPLRPAGTIVFERFSFSGEENINAVLKVSSRENEIGITGESVAIGQCVFNALDMRLHPADSDLGFTVSALSAGESTFNLEAILNYEPRQLEASLTLDTFSSLDLAQVFRPFVRNINIPAFGRSYMQNTSIAAEIFFTTDFNQIMYNAPNLTIAHKAGNEAGDVTGYISLSGTDQRFMLSEGVFFRAGKEFNVSAEVNFSNPHDLSFSLNANYLDISWQLEGQILDRAMLSIRSPNGLHAYGSVSNTGAVSGFIESDNFPVPFNNKPAYINSYIFLHYASKDFWSINAAHLEVRDFASSAGAGFLRVSGTADQSGARFDELLYSDGISALKGEADFSWSENFTNLYLSAKMSEVRDGRESYFVEGSLEERHFDLHAAVSGMRLDRFTQKAGRAEVDGEVNVSWDSINSFRAELNLASLYARIQENVIHASASAKLTHDEFTIHDLKLEYDDLAFTLPVLQLSRIENLALASADIQGFIFGKRLEGFIELDANFRPIDSWLEIKQVLNSVNGSFRMDNVQYAEKKSQEPFVFMFSRSNGALSVSGGPKNMLRIEMDHDGNFFAGLSSPFPIRSSVVGKLKDGFLDAHCSDLFVDLPALWSLLPPVSNFEINGGYIVARIDIRGPVGDPEFFGSARGSSLRLRAPKFIPHDIRPVPFNVIIEGSEMHFGPVTTVIGNGMGTVGGWFRFERWIPKNLGLEMTIPRETPVPYKFDITSFLAQGDVSGKLSITLDNSILGVKGDLFANNTEIGFITDDIAQPRPARDFFSDTYYSVITNLTITTGPVVEFIWPNTNFPILKANPELGTIMRVSVDTQNRQFSLNSDIKLRSGELYFFERSFYIRRGNLVFRENEREFAPRLSARAEIRDRTDSGPVTIAMIIENEPLLSFAPRFEAHPALTQLEIYSLLGQNLNSAQGENADAVQRFFLTSTTDLLAQFVVVRQFEKQIRNFLNLDMFSVRTRILQNAVLNATGWGPPPVDRNSRVGNYFDNTTVFGGKYIGQSMFVQGMLSMRYDENQLALGGLRFEPDFGVELQSPLISIRWDFIPYHPENWWVNDNSITLIWSRTF